MAVKVYLDPTGNVISVENGTATSNQINVKDFFFDKNDTTQEVVIRDKNDGYTLRTPSTEVQNQAGTPVGTYQAEMHFQVRAYGQGFLEKVVNEISSSKGFQSPTEKIVPLTGGCDFKWTAKSVSDNRTSISAYVDGYLILNQG